MCTDDPILRVRMFKIEKNAIKYENVFNSLLSVMENKKVDILYHGTNHENVEKIILNGFNREFNVRSKFGNGTDFAKDPYFAAKYCSRDENGYYALFVCKVIIGEYGLGYESMQEGSLYRTNSCLQYDSFVNDLENPQIFVINRDYHSFPVYIIVFKYRDEKTKKK